MWYGLNARDVYLGFEFLVNSSWVMLISPDDAKRKENKRNQVQKVYNFF